MAFKFSFIQSEETVCASPGLVNRFASSGSNNFKSPLRSLRPAKEIIAEDYHEQTGLQHLHRGATFILSVKQENQNCELHYIPSCAVEAKFTQNLSPENSVRKAIQLSSDLIPGEYEGGLKLWECAVDLLNYLNKDIKLELRNSKIFELGCGSGLPGIYCLLNNATVHFQDYNEEVINLITIPNVFVNSKVHNVCFSKSRFFSGDWRDLNSMFADMHEDDRYDCILMSETIYNPENYAALHNLLRTCLKRTGNIYVAAKTHYFGVGGSAELFKSYVAAQEVFKICPGRIYAEGVKREIFQLSFL